MRVLTLEPTQVAVRGQLYIKAISPKFPPGNNVRRSACACVCVCVCVCVRVSVSVGVVALTLPLINTGANTHPNPASHVRDQH